VRPRCLVFALLLVPALAQVGLLGGPRPSTEVRGTLQGDARQGYQVVVEFLVDGGSDPVQGSMAQSLYWNGTFSLWLSGWESFRLSGYTPGVPYNRAAFDVYDSQNRLRGRAGVTTAYDGYNRPSYHQVEYAVWPPQGQRVWMPSRDNPVPMEAGGWLSVTPPGGGARERYRYPGMESYRPPSVQGSIFSGLSLGDRDVAAKVLLSSLADLRAFYARQPRGSALWFFVPEVSAWTQTLAQEFGAQNGGQVRFVVPENTARTYCSLYRNDPRFHVMPRDTLPKEQSFAVIYPPSGATQKGAVMAGRHLVDRPDWQGRENDYVSFYTALSPTQDGLPEAQAYVWGYVSRNDLRARVWFRDWVLDSYENYWTSINFGPDWDGRLSVTLGRGEESLYLEGWASGATWSGARNFSVRDTQGRYRGYAYVYVQEETVNLYNLGTYYGRPTPEGLRFSYGGQTYTLRSCGRNWGEFQWTCSVVNASERAVGTAWVNSYYMNSDPSAPLAFNIQRAVISTGFRYTGGAYLRGWSQTSRYATDNDRPVEAGGYVTAEGKRYRIPGLEGYLLPTGKDLEAAEGDPYVSYITRSISPDRAPLGGTGRTEARVWFKPLSDWCREKGL
jgi:hypothetical protein